MKALSRRVVIFLSLWLLTTLPIEVTAESSKEMLERFPTPQENFQQHIQEVHEYLLDTQLSSRQPGDVGYNLPFELCSNDKARYRGKYLLIHGRNDSPAVWHDAAQSLALRGFDVRAILLPGHGNTPEAQLDPYQCRRAVLQSHELSKKYLELQEI